MSKKDNYEQISLFEEEMPKVEDKEKNCQYPMRFRLFMQK